VSLKDGKFGQLSIRTQIAPDIFECDCSCGNSIVIWRSLLVSRVQRDCGMCRLHAGWPIPKSCVGLRPRPKLPHTRRQAPQICERRVPYLGEHDRPLLPQDPPRVSRLRRSWDSCLRSVERARRVRLAQFPARSRATSGRDDARPHQSSRAPRTDELSMDYAGDSGWESAPFHMAGLYSSACRENSSDGGAG
jgi:hypothetical protein